MSEGAQLFTANRNGRGSFRGTWLIAVWVVAASGLLEARPAQGQATGSVRGTVVDDGGGAPLAGAVVTLEVGLSTTTAGDGAFVIAGVPAGDYTLTVTREGFAPLASGVTVASGPAVSLALRLPAAEFEELVVVTGFRGELG